MMVMMVMVMIVMVMVMFMVIVMVIMMMVVMVMIMVMARIRRNLPDDGAVRPIGLVPAQQVWQLAVMLTSFGKHHNVAVRNKKIKET